MMLLSNKHIAGDLINTLRFRSSEEFINGKLIMKNSKTTKKSKKYLEEVFGKVIPDDYYGLLMRGLMVQITEKLKYDETGKTLIIPSLSNTYGNTEYEIPFSKLPFNRILYKRLHKIGRLRFLLQFHMKQLNNLFTKLNVTALHYIKYYIHKDDVEITSIDVEYLLKMSKIYDEYKLMATEIETRIYEYRSFVPDLLNKYRLYITMLGYIYTRYSLIYSGDKLYMVLGKWLQKNKILNKLPTRIIDQYELDNIDVYDGNGINKRLVRKTRQLYSFLF